MRKKVFIMFLVIVVANFFTIPVFASTGELNSNEKVITPMFTYIFDANATLSINSYGKATAETYVTGNSEVTRITATINLQQYKDGNWTTIKTWNESSSSRLLRFSNTYYVSSGYKYRIKSTVTAYCGEKSESTTLTSNMQSY